MPSFSRFLIALVIILASHQTLQAQQARLITFDQLDSRLAAGADTTYIINLWATWCAPCLKELPHFERFAADLKGQKAKVILLSTDTRTKIKSAVSPMVKRLGLKNEVLVINENYQRGYFERIDKNWKGALPATLFINKARGKRVFYEKEFTQTELLETYRSFLLR